MRLCNEEIYIYIYICVYGDQKYAHSKIISQKNGTKKIRNGNQYLTRTIGLWDKNPNASKASYKTKQLSYRRTKLRLDKREYLILKLIFFYLRIKCWKKNKKKYALGYMSVIWSDPTRPWRSLSFYISKSNKNRVVKFWHNVDWSFKIVLLK